MALAKIIDDLLPREVFATLAENLMEARDYGMSDAAVSPSESDGSKFLHAQPKLNTKLHEASACFMLFSNKDPKTDQVHHLNYYLRNQFAALYEALNVKQMKLMRVNCTFAAQKNYVSAFHVDGHWPEADKMKTAILYLNSNNGGTQIMDGEFIQSKANRVAIFPCTQQHAGIWCTDKKLRFVLNMNYIEN
tara:strand:- start:310 stop:882 length:573 start_codon:yes stop_codon:yes gene_type:complete